MVPRYGGTGAKYVLDFRFKTKEFGIIIVSEKPVTKLIVLVRNEKHLLYRKMFIEMNCFDLSSPLGDRGFLYREALATAASPACIRIAKIKSFTI